MRFRDLLLESKYKTTSLDDFKEIVEDFCDLVREELGMDEMPPITIGMGEGLTNTFGFYQLDGEIFVEALNRHPMDILRTLGHELTHHWQNTQGVLHEDSGKDGSDHENEANSRAGVMLRRFAKKRPELFQAGPVSD